MDLEYIEEQVDVWIESQIKEKQLRRILNGKKILSKRNSNIDYVLLGNNSNKQSK